LGVLPGRAAELGGEHDLVAAPFQGLADDVLGLVQLRLIECTVLPPAGCMA
jgi:hypothetical protein